ncbi:MAG: GNAT family N-acetyltransferase [Bacteroidetes bacterium]|nr:GNAT family N-acetyltransferase [Bacteroidota bacterium]
MSYMITVAGEAHFRYAAIICQMMEESSKIRGTGIAKRKPEYIQLKMEEGKAVIALVQDKVIGFCYIESWEGQKYVANSGLIVHPEYRNIGLAKAIKQKTFELSKTKFPNAKLFGITTSLAVMKINSDLGYKPVTFSELTQDDTFWKGCESCTNYDILQRTKRTMCLCSGMVCDLSTVPEPLSEQGKKKAWQSFKTFLKERKLRIQKVSDKFPKLFKILYNEK